MSARTSITLRRFEMYSIIDILVLIPGNTLNDETHGSVFTLPWVSFLPDRKVSVTQTPALSFLPPVPHTIRKEISYAFIFQIMFTEFIAEMGDKTQLMLVALTSRFKLRDIIIGTAAAILVLNGLAVLLGGLVSEIIPTWLIRLVAASAFLFFAITSLKGDDDEEEETKEENVSRFAPLTVFCTFFVAELGDKTQLTAITFGANEGMNAAVTVWLACSIGLFAADILGMLIGYLLKSKTPDGMLNTLAFFIFAIFGNITMHEGLGLLLGKNHPAVFPVTMIIAVLFILASTFVFMKRIHRDKAEPNE